MLQFINGIRMLLWRRLELSRVYSVPRAIVYNSSIRQQVERCLFRSSSYSVPTLYQTASGKVFVVTCFPFMELYSGCALCYIVVTNRIEPAHCYVRSQHIVLQIWKHGTCNGIPYQKQSPVLYDMKLCSMEILIFKVLSVLNFLKTSLQPLARGIIQITTINVEKNDKFLPMPANTNYSTDSVLHIRVLEGHSYKCIIYII